MHGVGSDLHFHDLALGPDHGGMQGLVTVFLRVGNVIVELIGDVAPQRVDNTQCGVTVANLRNQDTYGANIVNLGKVDALAAHLSPDAVDVLGTSGQLALNAIGFQFGLQGLNYPLDVTVAIQALFVQQFGDLFVGGTMQVPERKIFQLPLDVTNAEPVGQGRVDIKHFPGDAHALFFRSILYRPNGAGTLRQLDQGNPDIVNHGDEHLADVVQLAFALAQNVTLQRVVDGRDGRHLLHAVDQARHLIAKFLADCLQGNALFTHGAIKDRRHQAGLIQVQLRQNLGHLDANPEAAGTRCPLAILPESLKIDFRCLFAGQPELVSVVQVCLRGYLVYPALDIHLAIASHCVVFANFYHIGLVIPDGFRSHP